MYPQPSAPPALKPSTSQQQQQQQQDIVVGDNDDLDDILNNINNNNNNNNKIDNNDYDLKSLQIYSPKSNGGVDPLQEYRPMSSPYGQQQQQQQQSIVKDNITRVAHFGISMDNATKLYEEWLNGLWFTPTGFKRQVGVDTLQKLYIPFYSFRAVYNVYFQGNVSYNDNWIQPTNNNGKLIIPSVTPSQQQQQQSVASVATAAILPSKRPPTKAREQGFITRTVNRIFLCASNSIDWQEYQDIRVLFDFNNVDAVSVSDFKIRLHQENANEAMRVVEEVVWARHKSRIEVEEQANALAYLVNQEQTPHIDNVSSNVQFLSCFATLYYVPFYHASYNFEDKTYSFFVDGQNGQVFATRPNYGLGKIGDAVKGVKNYFGMIFGVQEQVQKKRGAELASEDGTHVYTKDNYFVTWPRSATGLFSGYVPGWLTIRNKSSRPVTIRAQKRRGARKGAPIELGICQERSFTYKGHLCIEVLDGDYTAIGITYFSTTGGNEKSAQLTNLLYG
ncbi:hypothetical protein SAMD00019534_099600 [Acytostelium subglobosum LB1]|uniref:hypothetical protein n=1 Tax=Acytostelium subglobosum LB1 TaxID=1410327 RepID=UPI0006448EF0|nr:hypothetical protein SAMD00019534_099600 [Acytostelium subglobosum LB1]GAM26785.1 hypothetical protein SAMD00019534_099600 [Acytostelium subglobosum LB1]|eukprot:XP_012750446.1 hypothetical protein SAMD00019534_099600 [Acytostelium subglobosum LB1]